MGAGHSVPALVSSTYVALIEEGACKTSIILTEQQLQSFCSQL